VFRIKTTPAQILIFVVAAQIGFIGTTPAGSQELPAAIITLKDGQVMDVDVLNQTEELIDVAFPNGKIVRYRLTDIASIKGQGYKRGSPEYGRLLVESFNRQESTAPVLAPDAAAKAAVDTDDPKTAFERAEGLMLAGDMPAAVEYLNVAVNGKYRPWDSHYQRANAYFSLQDYTRAAEDFTQLIKLEPKDYVGYSNRGECLLKLDRPQDALADFNQALSLKPDDDYTYANRGMAYFSLGKNTEALADLGKSIELAPQGALNYSNRAVIYLSQKEYARAVDDLTKAIGVMPDMAGFYANRSAAYFYMKEFQKSYDDMLTAEKLGIPRNPQLELNLIGELYKIHFKKSNN